MEQPSITQIIGNESEPINLDVPPVPAKPIDNVFGDGSPEKDEPFVMAPYVDESRFPRAMTASQWRASGLPCPWEPIEQPQDATGDVKTLSVDINPANSDDTEEQQDNDYR